jgi:hypothetical protein
MKGGSASSLRLRSRTTARFGITSRSGDAMSCQLTTGLAEAEGRADRSPAATSAPACRVADRVEGMAGAPRPLLAARLELAAAVAVPGGCLVNSVVNTGTLPIMPGAAYRLERQAGPGWEHIAGPDAFAAPPAASSRRGSGGRRSLGATACGSLCEKTATPIPDLSPRGLNRASRSRPRPSST